MNQETQSITALYDEAHTLLSEDGCPGPVAEGQQVKAFAMVYMKQALEFAANQVGGCLTSFVYEPEAVWKTIWMPFSIIAGLAYAYNGPREPNRVGYAREQVVSEMGLAVAAVLLEEIFRAVLTAKVEYLRLMDETIFADNTEP